jgi:hypothetical protein
MAPAAKSNRLPGSIEGHHEGFLQVVGTRTIGEDSFRELT